MAKPIAMVIEVEEIAMGRVWRALDLMPGVVRISLQGAGPKAKANGAHKPKGGPTVPNLILSALQNNQTMSREALIEMLEANGKRGTSLPDSLTKLKRAKQITPAGKGGGTWKITATGKKVDTGPTNETTQ